jgi:thymidine phosphorylase
MREIIEAQSGDPRAVDDYRLLPQARDKQVITAPETGYVAAIDTEAIGHASMVLGAGRLRLDSPIDLSVGVIMEARIGDEVDRDSVLATTYFNDAARAGEAAEMIARSYSISPERVESPELIKTVLR